MTIDEKSSMKSLTPMEREIEKKFKLSIIIPVYNTAKYLRQCLNSIVAQSLKEIEIILIDDGSTDGSEKICDEYAEKDNRVRVFHKGNEGLSAARNEGIDVSTAPYIMFVDSDDWVEADFCRVPYLLAKGNNSDLVLFSFNRIYSDGTSRREDPGIQTGGLSEFEALRFNIQFTPAVWLGLYHRSLFKTIRYPDGKLYEEVGVSHRLIHEAKNVFLINKPLYNYRQDREGSITTAPETRNHPDLREMQLRKIEDISCWGYDDYSKELAIYFLAQYGSKEPDVKQVVDLLQKGSIPRDFSLKKRTIATILKFSPTLFDAICIAMGRRKR